MTRAVWRVVWRSALGVFLGTLLPAAFYFGLSGVVE